MVKNQSLKMEKITTGLFKIDKTKSFKYEKGEWNRSESFLKV